MFCPSCGKEIPDRSKVCGYCGHPIPERQPAPPPAPPPAPEPGPRQATSPPPGPVPATKPKPKKEPRRLALPPWAPFAGLGVLLVIVVIVVTCLVLSAGADRVRVESFVQATDSELPIFHRLAPGYKFSLSPGSHEYKVTLHADQAVLLSNGWCAANPEILDQNFEHITLELTIDGRKIDTDSLFWMNETRAELYCLYYIGVVRVWPGEHHQVITTMTFDQAISDGLDTYPSGVYQNIYQVTVLP